MTAASSRRWSIRRPSRRMLVVLFVPVILLASSVTWLGVRGWQAREHLLAAAQLADQLTDEALRGDRRAATGTLTALRQRTDAARAASRDRLWRVAGHTPYAGGNLTTVGELAAGLDELADRVAPALLAIDPATLLPTANRINVTALRTAGPVLAEADAVVRRLRARSEEAGRASGTRTEVRDALHRYREGLARIAALTGPASRLVALLPDLLGADGPRHYLLVFQNLAEPRATGGIFGAHALLRADAGRVSLRDPGPIRDLGHFFTPVLPLPAATRALYTDLIGIYPADVNLSPHFPTAAALIREMYRRHTGLAVDGVLAADPVVLAYLLAALGPVTVPGHTPLTASTAVRDLLSDTYRRLDDLAARDRYFAQAVGAVFAALLTRPVAPGRLWPALHRALTEQRLLAWSADPARQRQIEGTRLAGELPESEQGTTIGVFLNDGSGSKLGYYLTRRVELAPGQCRTDGRRQLRLRIWLGSTAPASGLSAYVLGLGLAGDPYTLRTLVYVHGPVGGTVRRGQLDGVPVGLGSGTERRRQVAVANVELRPGQTRLLELDLLTAPGSAGPARLRLTPGVAPWTTHVSPVNRCDQ